nr:hypothetical protein [candidate division Zixibacteria bacterium]NIR65986.1 hypothetical protein [candidate division Zixibacteria bacterium]NIS47629.1 hypothetical protein [candidate division Zixibacteria bacterium]NIU15721.1 hypothetical protein [candidate division Zixibacteria bacterium]NIV07880.1 hypothetical protein [candidate division Zixibacteria bacterium]
MTSNPASRHIEKLSGLSRFTPNERAREITGLPLNPRRKNPRMFLSPDAPRGYRAIYGVFDFTHTRHGVILIGPDGNIANVWQISQEDLPWNTTKDTNIFPHGFEIDRNGSIIVAFDKGSSLLKYDYCSSGVWARYGGFHHSVKFDGNGALWAWGSTDKPVEKHFPIMRMNLVKIDNDTGELLRMFHLIDIVNK